MWLIDGSKDLEPVFYKRNVEEMHLLFKKPTALFVADTIKKNYNVQFSYKASFFSTVSFLDRNLFR